MRFFGGNDTRALLLIWPLVVASSLVVKAAGLTIIPTFDSTITSDPNALTIEAGINAAIFRLDSDISTTVTAQITFAETGSGLGESSTLQYTNVPYSTYRSLLASHATSANDTLALSTLPNTTNNPVDGNSGVTFGTVLARALGYADNPGSDGTISLNTSIMNLSRTGAQNSGDYDLQAVVGHEMDEFLGVGGPGTALPGTTTGPVGVMDLYRYSAPGVRSFTTSSSATAYFSINGGTTDLVNFNQAGGGSDYADWGNGNTTGTAVGNTPAQLQDAFGTPGVDLNIGANELTGLDVIGYTLSTVPEPDTTAFLVMGLMALWGGLQVQRLRKRV